MHEIAVMIKNDNDTSTPVWLCYVLGILFLAALIKLANPLADRPMFVAQMIRKDGLDNIPDYPEV